MSARPRSCAISGKTRDNGIVVGLFTMTPTGGLPLACVTTTTESWKFGSGMSWRATRKTEASRAARLIAGRT